MCADCGSASGRQVSEWQRSSEQERTAQQRRHSRQLQSLSRAAAARLADLARQHQLATQQLLATGKVSRGHGEGVFRVVPLRPRCTVGQVVEKCAIKLMSRVVMSMMIHNK